MLAIILGAAYYVFAYTPNTSGRSIEKTASNSFSVTPTQGVTSIIPRSSLTRRGHWVARAGFFTPVLDQPTTIRLSQFKGKPLLVYFWASWCVPCRLESLIWRKPTALKGKWVYNSRCQYHFTRLLQDVRAFVKEFGLTFPILLDKTDSISQLYLVRGLPTSFFINRMGSFKEFLLAGCQTSRLKILSARFSRHKL